MYVFKILLSLLFITSLFGCRQQKHIEKKNHYQINNKYNTQKINMGFLDEIESQKLPPINDIFRNYIIVCFDGSCSACIVKFLEWRKGIRVKHDILYMYIMFSPDYYTVKYYLDQMGMTLNNNEYFLTDEKQIFKKYLSLPPNELMNIILTDSNYNVISIGNVFEAPNETLNQYLK